MKRQGDLLPRILDHGNLRLAFWRAARGKRERPSVVAFARQLDGELARLQAELAEGRLDLGSSRRFVIRDPKIRTIHAPPFRERVLHHALMNCCEAVFERGLIADTFACRVGKGRLAAIRRAEIFMRRHDWYLKLDVRNYFERIDQAILQRRLAGKFRESHLVSLFSQIVDHHHSEPGKGLPIGALTSQHFANDYLSPMDRFCKEELRMPGYVRYMDDVIVWSDDRPTLLESWKRLESFAAEALELRFKPGSGVHHTSHGVDFLGYRIWPQRTALKREAIRRLRRSVRGCHRAWAQGQMSGVNLQEKLAAWAAFVDGTGNFGERRRAFPERLWAWAERGEPGHPRRQLEELREEPAVRVAPREPTVEPERQPGLSPLISSGASPLEPRRTRPVSSPSKGSSAMAKPVAPAGVGSGNGFAAKAPAGALEERPIP